MRDDVQAVLHKEELSRGKQGTSVVVDVREARYFLGKVFKVLCPLDIVQGILHFGQKRFRLFRDARDRDIAFLVGLRQMDTGCRNEIADHLAGFRQHSVGIRFIIHTVAVCIGGNHTDGFKKSVECPFVGINNIVKVPEFVIGGEPLVEIAESRAVHKSHGKVVGHQIQSVTDREVLCNAFAPIGSIQVHIVEIKEIKQESVGRQR